jgi:hypothetical protein
MFVKTVPKAPKLHSRTAACGSFRLFANTLANAVSYTAAGFESGLAESGLGRFTVTVDCTALRGTKEVLWEFDKLTVGELL